MPDIRLQQKQKLLLSAQQILSSQLLQLPMLNLEAAVKLLLIDILVLKKGIKASKSANNLVESKLVAAYKKYKLQVVYLENEFIAWKSDVNERFEAALY